MGVAKKRTLMLLSVADLPRRFHQVFLVDVVPGFAFALHHNVSAL